jgi:hypothetical protein
MTHLVIGGGVGNSTLEPFLALLRRLGTTDAPMQAKRCQHERYGEDGAELIHRGFGGVPVRVEAMVRRVLETMPQWLRTHTAS